MDRLALAIAINPKAFEDAQADRDYFGARGEPDRVNPWTVRALGEAFAAADRVRVLLGLEATP